jgi:hypothetical protein
MAEQMRLSRQGKNGLKAPSNSQRVGVVISTIPT